jgi:hypothetical protein
MNRTLPSNMQPATIPTELPHCMDTYYVWTQQILLEIMGGGGETPELGEKS